MIIKIQNKDILWTYLSRFFRIGQGLLLLPLILRLLPSEQISVWSIYSSVLAFMVVFDLGFTNVFSRNATRYFTEFNSKHEDLANLIRFMRYFYRMVAVILVVIFAVFGSFYIISITQDLNNKAVILTSWFFLIGSSILNFYYNYLVIILQAKGLINQTQKIAVVGILLYLVLALTGVLMGGGLLALTASNFISVAYNRFLYLRLYKRELQALGNIKDSNHNFDFLLYMKSIWKTTYKVSLSSISSIVNYRFGIFILSVYANLEYAGAFAFSMNFIFLISEVSFMFYYSHVPQINSMAFANKYSDLLLLFKKSILISFVSFFLMGSVLILTGNYILTYIDSNMMLIEPRYIIIALVILFLDQIMSMSTNILFALNNLSYVWFLVITALIITLITLISCRSFNNYYSVLFPLLIVQLVFNFWRWPFQTIKLLKTKTID